MNPNEMTGPADDEISLLDLLLVVAENIRLLILGPLVTGLAALGIAFALPATYESEAMLRLGETSVPIFTSDDVLRPLLSQAPWITAQAHSPESALATLRQGITVSFNNRYELVTLKVRAPSAAQAHQLNSALIEAFRQHSLPKGNDLMQIQLQIPITKTALGALNSALERITNNIDATTAGPASDNAVRAFDSMSQQRIAHEKTLLALNQQLAGFGTEVFAQNPSQPAHPITPKKSLIAVLATLASGFALLLFVFVRQALRSAQQDPASAAKIAAIRRSIHLPL